MRGCGWRHGLALLVPAGGLLVALGTGCVMEDPEEQCQALGDRLCGRWVSCGVVSSMETCQAMSAAYLPCDRAVGVSSNYDECMELLEEADCSMLTPSSGLPDVCNGVILVPE